MIPLAAIMLCKNLGVGPFGIVGTATGLSGWKLIVAAALNILWGALMVSVSVFMHHVWQHVCFLVLMLLHASLYSWDLAHA